MGTNASHSVSDDSSRRDLPSKKRTCHFPNDDDKNPHQIVTISMTATPTFTFVEKIVVSSNDTIKALTRYDASLGFRHPPAVWYGI